MQVDEIMVRSNIVTEVENYGHTTVTPSEFSKAFVSEAAAKSFAKDWGMQFMQIGDQWLFARALFPMPAPETERLRSDVRFDHQP